MRIGYLASETNCNLTDYDSFLRCPDGNNLRTQLFSLLERMVPKENIEFTSFKIFSLSANGSFNNETLMDALANGMVDNIIYNLILTTERAEFLSFSTPFSFHKICFYTKRPQATAVVDSSWYFTAPFSSSVWILTLLSIVVAVLLYFLSKYLPYSLE